MTASRGSAGLLMRLLVIAAAIWAGGALVLQWPVIADSRHMLSIDLGPRPALGDAERALLAVSCADLPSARQRARCELDQTAARRSLDLWDAATAELRGHRADAWRMLGLAMAVALLPPAALLATGGIIMRTAGNDRRSPDS